MLFRSTETFLSSLLYNSSVRFLGYDGAHSDGKYVYDIYAACLRTIRNRQVRSIEIWFRVIACLISFFTLYHVIPNGSVAIAHIVAHTIEKEDENFVSTC